MYVPFSEQVVMKTLFVLFCIPWKQIKLTDHNLQKGFRIESFPANWLNYKLTKLKEDTHKEGRISGVCIIQCMCTARHDLKYTGLVTIHQGSLWERHGLHITINKLKKCFYFNNFKWSCCFTNLWSFEFMDARTALFIALLTLQLQIQEFRCHRLTCGSVANVATPVLLCRILSTSGECWHGNLTWRLHLHQDY